MEENFNLHLGKKLRMRRLSLGLTQTKVAEAINVTFQQIQKYEKGTNGVSSNRLMQLSSYLKVPITYFFEDFKNFNDIVISTLVGFLLGSLIKIWPFYEVVEYDLNNNPIYTTPVFPTTELLSEIVYFTIFSLIGIFIMWVLEMKFIGISKSN